MYKVININIGGRIFQIEEGAFESLSHYIDSLKQYFSTKQEGAEIVGDIEHRIAELLQAKLNAGAANITAEHVKEIIASVGSPKAIAGDEETISEEQNSNQQEQQSNSSNQTFEHERSKIFRDPDDKIISGVCSGLSYYFNIDPIFIRLIFVALFFAGGSSILIYLILIVVIPVAKTTAQKLAMRKEKINVNTIQKSVENEFNKIKESLENRNFSDRLANFLRKLFGAFGQVIMGVFTFTFKLIGFLFGVIGFLLVIVFIVAATGNIKINGHSSNITNFISMKLFENANDSLLGHTVIVFVIFSLMFMFFYWSAVILTSGKVFNQRKLFSRTLNILWLLTIVLFVISATKSSAYFRTKSSIEKTTAIDSSRTHFVIKTVKEYGDRDWLILKDDELKVDDVHLLIEQTDGPTELVQVVSSYGQDAQKAKLNAANCSYKVEIKDSIILLPEVYTLTRNKTYRKQKVEFILKLHKGCSFKIDNQVTLDIDGNTIDNQSLYASNSYAVVENGIKCIECLNSAYYSSSNDFNHSYSTGTFNKIIVSDNLTVNISEGNTQSINAKINESDDLIIEEKNGVLSIKLKNGWFSATDENIQISIVCPSLKAIELNGAAEASIEGFTTKEMEIKCTGASQCAANINPGFLKVLLSGTSSLELEGECQTIEAKVSGTSELNASTFLSQTATIESSGTSEIEVYASNAMFAKASGVSHIDYYGDPKTTKVTTSGMAEIQKHN